MLETKTHRCSAFILTAVLLAGCGMGEEATLQSTLPETSLPPPILDVHLHTKPPGEFLPFSPLPSECALPERFPTVDPRLSMDLAAYMKAREPYCVRLLPPAQTEEELITYPQLHVDIAVLNWHLPRSEFHRYLQRLVEAGFSDRIMFGSDQMIWPGAIDVAIESIESAAFLSDAQKRDIFYNNAASFLDLSPEEIARHHGK